MSIATPPPGRTLTAEQLMALPDDGVDRELIHGELRERPMTYRNRKHSEIQINVGTLLKLWRDSQPEPRGKVHGGDAAFRLRRNPETLVGIDVAYASAELVARTDEKQPFYDGPPVLAVEILSPSDTHEAVVEKVGLYLEAGAVVWYVDPDLRTVDIHRPGLPREALNIDDELNAESYLPGFRVAVAKIFD